MSSFTTVDSSSFHGLLTPPTLTDMVTDGANRVGGRADASGGLTVFWLLALFTLGAFVSRRRVALGLIGASAVALAVPGYTFIVAQRAGSPGRGEHAAQMIEAFRASVEDFSKAHGCAAVRVSQCTACDPVVDFALATTPKCASPASMVLGPDALSGPCTANADVLTCGSMRAR